MRQAAPFYDRAQELATLKQIVQKQSSSLIVIRGRRRIGKSRLIQEFAKGFERSYLFSGLPPREETTATTQRQAFAAQLTRVMGLPPVKSDDWGDLFWFMSQQVKHGKALIVLDEITWMGFRDPHFLSNFQLIWEQHLKHNPELVLIICGSVSAWIDENILKNTGFVGRISYDMQLQELPLETCVKFWQDKHNHLAPYEIFKVLSITGGVPWYLEHINPKLTAEDNIQNLCFNAGGVLFREFARIFADVFGRKNELYVRIVSTLINKPKTQQEILSDLKLQKSGEISKNLDNLIHSGFVTRDFSCNLQTAKTSKLSRYRLSDNYVRFYLRYILPNQQQIMHGDLQNISLASLPSWYSILGLQFENLVLNNRSLIKQKLGIHPDDIIYDNPYFQTATTRSKACQIDYLILTKTNNLYLIEIKLSKNNLKNKVIDEVREKAAKLNLPADLSIRPILITVGDGASKLQTDYFFRVLKFEDLLN